MHTPHVVGQCVTVAVDSDGGPFYPAFRKIEEIVRIRFYLILSSDKIVNPDKEGSRTSQEQHEDIHKL